MLTDPLSSAHVVASDFLDTSECAETVRRVNALRDRWTKRRWTQHSDNGFFTLGAASYLDGGESPDNYLAAAAGINPLLSNIFGDLYAGLLGFLQNLLNGPVSYDERLALPGFHIFQFNGKRSAGRPNTDGTESFDNTAAKRAHFDLQFLQAVPDRKPEATLSFTLPLAQPSGGAGLAVWPFRYEEALRQNLSGQGFAAQNPYEQVSYELGRMVLHDGFILHAILRGMVHPGEPAQKGQRITLQGHGIRTDGQWTIYW